MKQSKDQDNNNRKSTDQAWYLDYNSNYFSVLLLYTKGIKLYT